MLYSSTYDPTRRDELALSRCARAGRPRWWNWRQRSRPWTTSIRGCPVCHSLLSNLWLLCVVERHEIRKVTFFRAIHLFRHCPNWLSLLLNLAIQVCVAKGHESRQVLVNCTRGINTLLAAWGRFSKDGFWGLNGTRVRLETAKKRSSRTGAGSADAVCSIIEHRLHQSGYTAHARDLEAIHSWIQWFIVKPGISNMLLRSTCTCLSNYSVKLDICTCTDLLVRSAANAASRIWPQGHSQGTERHAQSIQNVEKRLTGSDDFSLRNPMCFGVRLLSHRAGGQELLRAFRGANTGASYHHI